jgi:hypothetical protein
MSADVLVFAVLQIVDDLLNRGIIAKVEPLDCGKHCIERQIPVRIF